MTEIVVRNLPIYILQKVHEIHEIHRYYNITDYRSYISAMP